MGSEKIIRLQESLIKGYKKEIDILEKQNANLREMLERQNVIIESQKRQLEVFERFLDKVQKIHEKAGSDRNAADAAENGTTENQGF